MNLTQTAPGQGVFYQISRADARISDGLDYVFCATYNSGKLDSYQLSFVQKTQELFHNALKDSDRNGFRRMKVVQRTDTKAMPNWPGSIGIRDYRREKAF